MGVIQLSHTAVQKYLASPKAYYFHYIRRIREENIGSALPFGNALDLAFNELLVPTGKDPYKIFERQWTKQDINGKKVDLRTYDKIKYSKSDYFDTFFDESDEKLLENCNKNWVSLRKKGFMMLDAFKAQILPHLSEIIAVQKYIKLPSEDGHRYIGYIDYIAKFKVNPEAENYEDIKHIEKYNDKVVLFDNKTSSIKYKTEQAAESEQLAGYYEAVSEEYNIDLVGYTVIHKNFRKRKKPFVPVQFILNEVREEILESTFDGIEKALEGIKMGEFPCNAPACDMPWGKCCYSKLCKEGSLEGIIELPTSRKGNGNA